MTGNEVYIAHVSLPSEDGEPKTSTFVIPCEGSRSYCSGFEKHRRQYLGRKVKVEISKNGKPVRIVGRDGYM